MLCKHYSNNCLYPREENTSKVPLGDYSSKKKALVLGAGYVSAPVVEYLTRDPEVGITVAAALKSEADSLATKYERTEPVLLNVMERYVLKPNYFASPFLEMYLYYFIVLI